MNDTAPTDLEHELGRLTEWTGPAPSLWAAALAAAGRVADGHGWRARLRQVVPGWAVVGAAAATILIVVGLVSPGYYGAAARAPADAPRLRVARTGSTGEPAYATEGIAAAGQPIGGSSPADAAPGTMVPRMGPAGPTAAPTLGHERQVVRKVTIDLAAQDVRTAFFKASHLVSEAHAEYVQDSSLTGAGPHLQATLTLRVAVGRLSDVLNELRTLGNVRSETSRGEDVTGQIVDLEARLRNEQRVESELLDLLQSRADAPLKEILELRTALAEVRQTIERLTAQRERFSGLVALATVAVVIVPADAPPPPAAGLWAYFVQTIESAWHGGVTFLVGTLAGLLAVVVGGLIWWALLAVIVFVVRARLRRRAAGALGA